MPPKTRTKVAQELLRNLPECEGKGGYTVLEDRHDLVQAIESIADMMLVLSELEAASEQMVDVYFQNNRSRDVENNDRYRIHQIRQVVGDVERQARSIRAYLVRLNSTLITWKINEEPGLRKVER